MDNSKKQMPVTVEFQGATLEGVVWKGRNYVALKPVAEGIGLDWAGQFTKAKEHPTLSAVIEEIPMTAADGKKYRSVCIPDTMLPFWLALVQPNKVKKELREKVIRFQTEAAAVLAKAFLEVRQGRKELSHRFRIMCDVLKENRQELGKDTLDHHYANEARMLNRILTGKWEKLERDLLPAADQKLLTKLEIKNSALMYRYPELKAREAILSRFVAEERARTSPRLEAAQ